eukprot:Skav218779  [mRNA]  locus=scaffold1372:412659:413767:- [translate_table: standard]
MAVQLQLLELLEAPEGSMGRPRAHGRPPVFCGGSKTATACGASTEESLQAVTRPEKLNQKRINCFNRIASLNNFMRQRHKKSGRRGVAPQIMYTDRPDNPWKDRYLICQDCEKRVNYERLPPRTNCNNSTVMELDMTAQFSRDNCMVTSCEVVQMIKDDIWVLKDEHGRITRAPEKRAPAFPVQVLLSTVWGSLGISTCWKGDLA